MITIAFVTEMPTVIAERTIYLHKLPNGRLAIYASGGSTVVAEGVSDVEIANALESITQMQTDNAAFINTVNTAISGLDNRVDAAETTVTGLSQTVSTHSGQIAAHTTEIGSKISSTEKGAAGGVCELNENQLIPSIRLPGYVDDIIEVYAVGDLPAVGEAGKIYVIIGPVGTDAQYRWAGSTWHKMPSSPGTTDDLVEGSGRLYFTTDRVLGTLLTGLSLASSAAVVAGDSILSSIGKLQKQINDLITAISAKFDKTGGTMTGDLIVNSSNGSIKSKVGSVELGSYISGSIGKIGMLVSGSLELLVGGAFTAVSIDGNTACATFNGGIVGTVVNLGVNSTLDLRTGNYFYKTITGVTNLAMSNPPASGKVFGGIIELTNAGAFTVNFWANCKWETQPSFTAAGIDRIRFDTRDGGNSWILSQLDKDPK